MPSRISATRTAAGQVQLRKKLAVANFERSLQQIGKIADGTQKRLGPSHGDHRPAQGEGHGRGHDPARAHGARSSGRSTPDTGLPKPLALESEEKKKDTRTRPETQSALAKTSLRRNRCGSALCALRVRLSCPVFLGPRNRQ